MCSFVEEKGITGLERSPLAMGLLTGKYNQKTNFSKDDLRGKNAPVWMTYFVDGKPNEIFLKKLENIREILTSKGRTWHRAVFAGCWEEAADVFRSPD